MSESSRPTGGPPPASPVNPVPLGAPAASAAPPGGEGGAADAAATPSPRRPARRGRRLAPPPPDRREAFTPQQRLLILDAWQRSGLPARDFAPLVGVSRHTLYSWKQRFDRLGPEGLLDQPRGAPGGSRLPELTRRAILLLK